MGPITLFDKSFLQNLKVDESVWFDMFFLPNICPIFYVEVLADLSKKTRPGRTPEDEVRIIADKAPQIHGYPNVYHLEIATGNLFGNPVNMDGRVIVPPGKAVKSKGKSGVVLHVAPEIEAFSRWQQGRFDDLEREFAHQWRKTTELLKYPDVMRGLEVIGALPNTCKSFEHAKTIADEIIHRELSEQAFTFLLILLGVSERYWGGIFERWQQEGYPPIAHFAPYAAFVVSTEIFFHVALVANLLSRKKTTDKIDLAYLAYLPFCMVFISSDKFHHNCAPLFLREDQNFVWGLDLKKDLAAIDAHFDKLPEKEKEKGLFAIAPEPPETSGIVRELWEKHLPGWKPRDLSVPMDPPPQSNPVIEEVSAMVDAKGFREHEIDFDPQNPDSMIVQHFVSKKKGKWYQVPKGLKPRPKK